MVFEFGVLNVTCAVALVCCVLLAWQCLRLRARAERAEWEAAVEVAAAEGWRRRCMDAEARARGVGGGAGAPPVITRIGHARGAK